MIKLRSNRLYSARRKVPRFAPEARNETGSKETLFPLLLQLPAPSSGTPHSSLRPQDSADTVDFIHRPTGTVGRRTVEEQIVYTREMKATN